MLQAPPARPGMQAGRGRYTGAADRSRCVRSQSRPDGGPSRGHECAVAGPRQNAQIAGDRASADRARRGRANACKRSRRRRRWRGAVFPTFSSATKSWVRRSSPAWRPSPASPEMAVCADDAAQVAAIEAAAADAGVRLPVLVEIDVGARALRRGARARRGRARTADRRLAASDLRRAAGVSRQRATPPPARGAAFRNRCGQRRCARERSSSCASAASTARSSAVLEPARSSSRPHRASSPKSRPAAIASWTPTTRAISTPAASRSGCFVTRCSCSRP